MADTVTGFMTTYGPDGLPLAGVTVRAIARDVGLVPVSGLAVSGVERSIASDANGLVQFPNLFKGVTYSFRRGTSVRYYTVKIPADAVDPYELPTILGAP